MAGPGVPWKQLKFPGRPAQNWAKVTRQWKTAKLWRVSEKAELSINRLEAPRSLSATCSALELPDMYSTADGRHSHGRSFSYGGDNSGRVAVLQGDARSNMIPISPPGSDVVH